MTIKSNKKMYVTILLSAFLIILLKSTVNAESIPFNITIGGNGGESVSSVNLILGEHDTETLKAKVKDSSLAEIEDASVTWESDNTQVVTVNSSSGMLTAVGEGTAKITATSGDVKDECEVTVYPRLKTTNFSQAKYESTLNWTTET